MNKFTPPHADNLIFIGDVHGCLKELLLLLQNTGSTFVMPKNVNFNCIEELEITVPENTQYVFLGDLCDRGPSSLGTYALAMKLCNEDKALMTPGNHDDKMLRYLQGHATSFTDGFKLTHLEMEALPEMTRKSFSAKLRSFLVSLPSHLLLKNGTVCASHAGLPLRFHGQDDDRTYMMAIWGERKYSISGPRLDPADKHVGDVILVHGHTPVDDPTKRNNVINIDTGCVFGGKLTGYILNTDTFVSIPAEENYFHTLREKL